MSALDLAAFDALALERDGDLLWVTLDDPGRANALSPAMIGEITDLYSLDLRAEDRPIDGGQLV